MVHCFTYIINKSIVSRIFSGIYLLLFTLVSISPIFLSGNVSASQITSRSITLSTSKISATGVTYAVSFKPVSSTAIKGIVVDICQNSPLIGISCTTTNGVTSSPTTGTVAVAHTGATGTPVSFSVDASSASTGKLVLTHATGLTPITTTNAVTFSFTATNPSGTSSTSGAVGTFYARIVTYSTTAGAQGYTSTSPGTHLDDGGVALSTARQLTVNAKVQEQLTFCIGAVDSTVTNVSTFNTYNGGSTQYCGGTAFSSANPTVDLGSIGSSSPSISPIAVASGGNGLTGALMIQTNAYNGASITYFPEQDTSSGRLKVVGATCSGSTGAPIADAGSSVVDQCFNSNSTQASFATASTEEFGMTGLTPYQLGTTANLTRNSNYDGDGTSAGGFAWDQSTTPISIASSTSVLDYEAMVLKFAAQTAPTTPTGSYTVTSTFIATGTF